MNVPGGGKNDIPNRLKRQFALFNVPLPSVAAINGIFGRLVEGRFSAEVFSAEVGGGAGPGYFASICMWLRMHSAQEGRAAASSGYPQAGRTSLPHTH
jgi:dynein heavy chain